MDESFFKQAYERDATNKAKQSWSDYWGWVKTFYAGKSFPPVPGWSAREKDLVAKAPAQREAIERTGRALAAEWAKDNSVRKVATSDLQAWGKRFSDAAKTSDGLAAALAEVEGELKKRGAI
ncbi:MAG TPA: hypothetical protein VM370_06500 [Candidatus Thermoplasmatota archaeon]|nr:hypothetical protein [Candidatus Thermoplasmatota archaeon]